MNLFSLNPDCLDYTLKNNNIWLGNDIILAILFTIILVIAGICYLTYMVLCYKQSKQKDDMHIGFNG